MKSIQLRTLGAYGQRQFVDNPSFGSLQPDLYGVYTEGCSNKPIPQFADGFVEQFLEKSKELGCSSQFVNQD